MNSKVSSMRDFSCLLSCDDVSSDTRTEGGVLEEVQSVPRKKGSLNGSGFSLCVKIKALQTLGVRVPHGRNDVQHAIKSNEITILSVSLYP